MKRVIVCVKHVPCRITIDKSTGSVKRENVDSEINPHDLYAIEEAIRIKEKCGFEVCSITMGVKDAVQSVKKALAMGVDNGFLLTDKAFAAADTQATSYTLAQGIKNFDGFDLIICGKQSSDGDTAQVGVQIAEKLSIPFATNVDAIEIDNNRVRCKRRTQIGYEIVEFNMPGLITVSKGINEPRIPTVKNLIKAETANITCWDLHDIGADINRCGKLGSPTVILKSYAQKRANSPCSFEMRGDMELNSFEIIKMINSISMERL